MANLTPNENQQKAIDILDGQVMLLAGPGTGKTFTIIRRIESMIEKGIKPSSILCLAFSEAAANEMRQRLISEIGVVASSVNIYTYHSFCNDIIKTHPMQFEMNQNVKVIDDTEKIMLMRECIDEVNPEVFVPNRSDRYYWTGTFIGFAEKLKAERATKESYMSCLETNPNMEPKYKAFEAEICEREARGEMRNKDRYKKLEKVKKDMEKAKEVWALYELYSQKMKEKNLIDFSDMINFVLDKFESDKEFASKISNEYEYFLVDEYQDTNASQNSIIFNLVTANKNNNVFVVGDDDQIIYAFQGAELHNIENFLSKYPETEVICLQENNRSTQSILDFSYEVISQDKNRLEENETFKNKNISKKLTAKNKSVIAKNKKVKRLHFGEKMQEINYIVDKIDSLINSYNCPKDDEGNKQLSEIAIICRKNPELLNYAEILKSKNIRYQISQGKSVFSIRSTILIYFYLKALNNYLNNSDKLFGLLLAEPFKINLEDYNKILKEKTLDKHKNKSDFITMMQILSDWKEPQKINNFLETFETLKKYSQNNDLRNTILEIINRTGILEYFFKEPQNKMENLMGIKKIIDDASEFEQKDPTVTISEYVEYIDTRFNDGIDISIGKTSIVQNAIQLTTYHSSKGREFEYVYLPNLVSTAWEDYKNPSEQHLITEEVLEQADAEAKKDTELLKLLFVGITRAKHDLTISFADKDNGSAKQITKYLANFSDYDFESQYFECNEEASEKALTRQLSRDVYDHQKAFKEEIAERANKVVLSPSRLNDYGDCPRKFFYTKIIGIDIEEAAWDDANFGSAIHKILENAVNVAKSTGKYPTVNDARKEFLTALENSRFTNDAKRENFEKKGMNVIDNYYAHFIQFSPEHIYATEFNFEWVKVDDDFIKGKIDRVEINNNGTYALYDYKTGVPSSVKQFTANGDKVKYYNQLCFYKYAFEKYMDVNVSQVGIIYVEDHTKNVYLTLGAEDMDYIENKIRDTYKQIKSLKFTPIKEASKGPCKFCAYKNLCRIDIL